MVRSLPFLEKGGVAWMSDRGCMSCHHVPFLVWSHRAAQARGFTLDARKLAEWEEWCRQDSLGHRNTHRLQTYDLGKVAAEKLPEVVKTKLKPLIEQPFKSEAEFAANLSPLLTGEELKAYEAIITKTAKRLPNAPDRTGGGLDVLAQLILGTHGAESVLAEPTFRDGAIAVLNRHQAADGSWPPGQQFATLRRWPLPAADQSTTMWAALALAAYDAPGAVRSDVIEKAIAYQRQQPAQPDNHEWLATLLLFEGQFGNADGVAKLRQQLLAVRNGDGGWGWEKGVPSDALTTGLVLYVLAKVHAGDDADVIHEARQHLLTSQQPDGSWLTPSKNITKATEPGRLKARDEIYHYWGTAWVVIGLLETIRKPGE